MPVLGGLRHCLSSLKERYPPKNSVEIVSIEDMYLVIPEPL